MRGFIREFGKEMVWLAVIMVPLVWLAMTYIDEIKALLQSWGVQTLP